MNKGSNQSMCRKYRIHGGVKPRTPCPEKNVTLLLPLTLWSANRFSKFFQQQPKTNFHARLSHSKQLLKNIYPMTSESFCSPKKTYRMTDYAHIHQPRLEYTLWQNVCALHTQMTVTLPRGCRKDCRTRQLKQGRFYHPTILLHCVQKKIPFCFLL